VGQLGFSCHDVRMRDDAVRQAIVFMTDRLGEPLSVAQVATAAHLSPRTLHRMIRRDYGVSPMVLLRRLRLAKGRAELEAPRAETTVTRTALQWGFSHLGRFSADYARRFGESPSRTLRRARQAIPPGANWRAIAPPSVPEPRVTESAVPH
jgi:transcriptional regulator GlxA family with amidase domain